MTKKSIYFFFAFALILSYILVLLFLFEFIEKEIFIAGLPLVILFSILYGTKGFSISFLLIFSLNLIALVFAENKIAGIISGNYAGIAVSFFIGGLVGFTSDLYKKSKKQLKELEYQKELLQHETEAKLKAESELRVLKDSLEEIVEKRASELKSANQKLALVLKDQYETEISLRKSEEYYRLLFESVHDAILIYNPETELILDVNKTACELYGYKKEELINSPVYILSKTGTEKKKSNKLGIIYKDEAIHFKKDGSPVILSVSTAAIIFKGEKVILSANRDITQQKQEEEKIHLLANALESINDSVIISDINNKILFANKSFLNNYLYSNAEIIGQPDNIIFPSGEAFPLYENLNAEILEKRSLKYESENIKKNSEIFPVSFSLSAVKDNNAKIIARIFVIEDITVRKSIENELKIYKENLEELIEERTAQLKEINEKLNKEIIEKEKVRQQILEMNIRLDMAITASGNGFIDIQLDRKKVYVSPVFLKLLGYNSLDYNMVVNNWRRFVHCDDVKIITQSLNKHIENKTSSAEFVHRILTRKGIWKWFSTKLKIVERDSQNCPQRISVVLDDITVRKIAEEEIEKNLKKEKELGELKSRFVSTVSHEFRTPLTSIYASTELLLRYFNKWSDEKISKTLMRIKESVDFMHKMITEILTINRADSGRLEFQPAYMDVISLCKNILEEVQIIAKPVHQFIFKSEYDSFKGNFDEKLLRYILQNLLSNSIKYSPEGGMIELKIIKEPADLIISVKDEGIGIDEEDQEKLFTPFFRGKNTATIPGTGLGLSILKRSVDLHGGRINFESNPGKGTTFYFYLPLN